MLLHLSLALLSLLQQRMKNEDKEVDALSVMKLMLRLICGLVDALVEQAWVMMMMMMMTMTMTKN
jgi:hypothetical protein